MLLVAAAKRLELHVADDLVLVDIQINPHDIAAFGVADGPCPAGVLDLSDIVRILEMIHYFL